jgi:hypothetical protein
LADCDNLLGAEMEAIETRTPDSIFQ